VPSKKMKPSDSRPEQPNQLIVELQEGVEQHLTAHNYSTEEVAQFRAALPRPGPISLRANTLRCTAEELLVQVRDRISTMDHDYAAEMAATACLHPTVPDVVLLHPVPSKTVLEALPLESPKTAHVWVDRHCGEAVLKGATVYAPGIVGMSDSCAVGDRVSVFVDIEGSMSKGASQAGSGPNALVANGVAKMGRQDVSLRVVLTSLQASPLRSSSCGSSSPRSMRCCLAFCTPRISPPLSWATSSPHSRGKPCWTCAQLQGERRHISPS